MNSPVKKVCFKADTIFIDENLQCFICKHRFLKRNGHVNDFMFCMACEVCVCLRKCFIEDEMLCVDCCSMDEFEEEDIYDVIMANEKNISNSVNQLEDTRNIK